MYFLQKRLVIDSGLTFWNKINMYLRAIIK